MDLRFLDPNGQPTREAFNERFEFLNALTPRLNNISNEYVWERTKIISEAIPAGYTLGAVQTNVNVFTVTASGTTVGWYYSNSVKVDSSGTVSLATNSRQTVAIKNIATVSGQLAGKFIQIDAGATTLDASKIYYIPSDATVSYVTPSGRYCGRVSKLQVVNGYGYTEAVTEVDYFNSQDPNAYPPAESGEFIYHLLGKLGDKVRIETGSYVGTGKTQSEENASSLTFGFKPKLVFIATSANASDFILVPCFNLTASYKSYGYIYHMSNNLYLTNDSHAKLEGNTVSWYWMGNNDSNYQCNNSTRTYNYIAIG